MALWETNLKFVVENYPRRFPPTLISMNRRKLATIGERSSIPIRGKIERIGKRIGSVISMITR